MTVEFKGLDAIEKAILDARCAVLTRDPHKAVDHLAKAIELLRAQWDEKYGKHLPSVDADPARGEWSTSYLRGTGEPATQAAKNIAAAQAAHYVGQYQPPPGGVRYDELLLARGMMNAIQPTHEEKVRAAFRDIRQSAKDLVFFERIVYGVPGEDDPPSGEGDRKRRAHEAERLSSLMDDLGQMEPESLPVAALGERVFKLLTVLDKRRDVVQMYRHGMTHLLWVVDRERDVDGALQAITETIAYDWGEQKPDPIKMSLLDRFEEWLNKPAKPWYRRFTSHQW